MRWLIVVSTVLLLFGCASKPTVAPPDLSRPSIAETKSVVFAGKTYVLKYQARGNVPLWEYFLAPESVNAWSELVDFRLAPPQTTGNEPRDLANLIAQAHKQEYPNLPVEMFSDEKTDAIYVLLFYPTSTRKDGSFFEFNIFKYYKDNGTGQIISFHFAKNIPSDTPAARQELPGHMARLRAEVIPAMGKFPLYRQ
ncbi:hypothetical protein HX875_22360 [Pseudomonas yamanorum]|uniref:hypothetical protein n=1 Tax=Pseudomonas yamanorum TaxID=515393 RepID=UPI0015A109A2|nr:hypothetical protein [Pseudomonas yamanorum]NWE42237.1 hypothetical protein [Pseudomonas yamanorum]